MLKYQCSLDFEARYDRRTEVIKINVNQLLVGLVDPSVEIYRSEKKLRVRGTAQNMG